MTIPETLPDFDRIDVEDGTMYRNTKALIGVKEHEDGEIRIFIGNFTVNDAFLLREAANEIVYAVGRKARAKNEQINDTPDDEVFNDTSDTA